MKNLNCTPILLPLNMQKTSPKECVGMIFKNSDKVLSIIKDLEDVMKSNSYFGAEPQHLYFVSKREIKKGDYFIDDDILTPLTKICKCVDSNYGKDYDSYIKDESGVRVRGFEKCHKIEATTNPSLGLPNIPQSCIEEYVSRKNKEVAIELESYMDKDSNADYEINDAGYAVNAVRVKTIDGMVIMHPVKDSWSTEEVESLVLFTKHLEYMDGSKAQHEFTPDEIINQWAIQNTK